MRLVINSLISFLMPDACLVCGNEPLLLHPDCQDSLLKAPPSCIVCGSLNQDYRLCKPCRRSKGLDVCYFYSSGEDIVRGLVAMAKFRSNKSAVDIMADMTNEVTPDFMAGFTVTHVPSASSRIRQRGYDHSRELALGVARLKGLDHLDLLCRNGQTRQLGSNKRTRVIQSRVQYSSARPSPERVLLVDDLYTTGATMAACAAVLRRSGAKHVYGCLLGRMK